MENLVKTFDQLKVVYGGKRIFLTGHTGFKGSWMLKLLSMLGANVKGYSLAPKTDKDLFNLIDGTTLCDSVIADIRDRDRLNKEISDFQPDFVFHLAAQPLVRLSYQIPSETFEVNAVGTANLLDGIRLLVKSCQVILITTDKVYHNNEWIYPYREDDPLGGFDPYSASKACAELVINSYRNSFFNINDIDSHRKSLAVGRAGNVIGGGDWSEDRLIPDIARALSINEPIIVRNPESIRPWQHVLEPIVAYLTLGSNLVKSPVAFSQAYNFGPYVSDALSVEEMLQLAISSWGTGTYKIERASNQPHEAGLLKLDISKSISHLGWKPKMNASEAVSMTMDWYREYSERSGNINHFTEMQIKNYIDA